MKKTEKTYKMTFVLPEHIYRKFKYWQTMRDCEIAADLFREMMIWYENLFITAQSGYNEVVMRDKYGNSRVYDVKFPNIPESHKLKK